MLSSIAQGHVDLADILFLIAFILCCIAFVVQAMVRPLALVTLCLIGAVGLLSLGFFVL